MELGVPLFLLLVLSVLAMDQNAVSDGAAAAAAAGLAGFPPYECKVAFWTSNREMTLQDSQIRSALTGYG